VRILLEVIGWASSVLVVVSLTQARVLRFRWLNLVGSALAVVYNTALAIWPFAAMNLVIAVINVYWLRRLVRERHDPAAYSVIEVSPTDGYLRHVLGIHLDDIRAFQPSYAVPTEDGGSRFAFLVQREAETVGAVVVRDQGDGEGLVELDYVTERFRDCSPGGFVYGQSGVFDAHGLRRLVAAPELARWSDYLTRVGFRRDGDAWIRDLAPA
jgi:hypothetical protein